MPPETRPGWVRRHPRLCLAVGLVGLVFTGLGVASALEHDFVVLRRARQFEDPDPKVRANAVQGVYMPTAIFLRGRGADVVLRGLDDPDPVVRKHAVYEVRRLGDRAKPAVPRLFELLADPVARGPAVRTLVDLGPHPPVAADDDIVRLLAAPDSATRRAGLVEVVRLGLDGRRLLLPVAGGCDDPDPLVRGLCFDLFTVFDRRGPEDDAAARVLGDKYRDMPRDDPRWIDFEARFLKPDTRP